MSLNDTPSSERTVIGFFGCRNAGKSSLVNAVTGQSLSVVSDVLGTTTDPVRKAMEILPLGPVLIIDTPGYDDVGALGEQRVKKTREILRQSDLAVLVAEAPRGLRAEDRELLGLIRERGIPCIIAYNKADLSGCPAGADPADTSQASGSGPAGSLSRASGESDVLYVSALKGTGIHELKEKLGALNRGLSHGRQLLDGLAGEGDRLIFVCPIDESAPKGRLILPQQQAIRDALDRGACALVTQEAALPALIASLREPPACVVTDSQAFRTVSEMVPDEIPLTSFSILMARYKGFLSQAVSGAAVLDQLRGGDRILMAEGCTHHRQCNDIGTVKIPRWLKAHTSADLVIETCSGREFPEDLTPYRLVIHCGGCMLGEREMQYRMHTAKEQGVPFTNYGIAIAKMTGILERSIRMFPEEAKLIRRQTT